MLSQMPNIKLLTFTSLYPNNEQPNHGIFVENRLRHLLDSGQFECKVIAPVPWFPFSGSSFGSYGRYAKIPRYENRHGIDIYHPRYLVIPKIGMTAAPLFMAIALLPVLKTILKTYPFDIIDAHYFYPDGVAAVAIGNILNKPVIVTARGTDLNLISQFLLPRKQIQWAARGSTALITVCQALKDRLVDLGIEDKKIHTLRNGVDLDLFCQPENRGLLKEQLGLSGTVILSVGQLVRNKGHEVVVNALSYLPDVTLLIAGCGPEKLSLLQFAQALGVAQRVRFLGNVPHKELPIYYGAADVLALASRREGWPNVLLEAMACGTPVVVSNVGGVAEVVCSPEAGLLVENIEAEEFARAIKELLANPLSRQETRQYAEQFSWEATTNGQLRLFSSLISANKY